MTDTNEVQVMRDETTDFNREMEALTTTSVGESEMVPFPQSPHLQESELPNHIGPISHEKLLGEINTEALPQDLSIREIAMLKLIYDLTGLSPEQIKQKLGTDITDKELVAWYQAATKAEEAGAAPASLEQATVWRAQLDKRKKNLNQNNSPIPESKRIYNPIKIITRLFKAA